MEYFDVFYNGCKFFVRKKQNLAFTLAEVLITLGIIGIVAAMTIPSLMNNAQDYSFQQGYKKIFSVISNASKQAQADDGMMNLYETLRQIPSGGSNPFDCKS